MDRYTTSSCCVALMAALALAAPTPVGAQGQTDGGNSASVKIGPLALTPAVSLTTGLDTNVLNQEADLAQQDVTARLTPEVDAWLRIGRLRLHTRNQLANVYYKKFVQQRSLNVLSEAELDVDLNRFVPFVSAGFISTRDRVSSEIDGRPPSQERRVTLGHRFRLSSKTFLEVAHQRTAITFGDSADFRGVDLQQSLNSQRIRTSAALRITATPVTTASVQVDLEREEFEFSPFRDARTVRVVPVVEFSPFALVSGRAAVGFRSFTPNDPTVPPFEGLVAAVDLGYTMRGATRLSVRADRDVTYSYDPRQPYYLLNGYQVGLAQRLTDTLDATASYRQQRLNYRSVAASTQQDIATSITVGLSQIVNRHTRFGVVLEHARRASAVVTSQYEGIRVNTSIDYRF
ncbi:MAG: outer membrane beta-barrel protein [Luteitalea sp.]|nr:outer membrane beta-barrel protein [Luteitalea sp.]